MSAAIIAFPNKHQGAAPQRAAFRAHDAEILALEDEITRHRQAADGSPEQCEARSEVIAVLELMLLRAPAVTAAGIEAKIRLLESDMRDNAGSPVQDEALDCIRADLRRLLPENGGASC